MNFFARGDNPDRVLTDEDLEKYSKENKEAKEKRKANIEYNRSHPNEPPRDIPVLDLARRSETKKGTIEKSKVELEKLTNEGFVIKNEKYGPIVVYIAKKGQKTMSGGWEAAQAFGNGVYIIWNPDENSFVISFFKAKPETNPLEQGTLTHQGGILIKPRNDEPLKVTLSDILKTLSDGKHYDREYKLKEYLDNEAIPSAKPAEKPEEKPPEIPPQPKEKLPEDLATEEKPGARKIRTKKSPKGEKLEEFEEKHKGPKHRERLPDISEQLEEDLDVDAGKVLKEPGNENAAVEEPVQTGEETGGLGEENAARLEALKRELEVRGEAPPQEETPPAEALEEEIVQLPEEVRIPEHQPEKPVEEDATQSLLRRRAERRAELESRFPEVTEPVLGPAERHSRELRKQHPFKPPKSDSTES